MRCLYVLRQLIVEEIAETVRAEYPMTSYSFSIDIKLNSCACVCVFLIVHPIQGSLANQGRMLLCGPMLLMARGVVLVLGLPRAFSTSCSVNSLRLRRV